MSPYFLAQAQQKEPLEEPIKVDNSTPRNVVVVDTKEDMIETALRKADEAGGALFSLLLLGLIGFVMLGGHKKIFGVFDAITQLINLLRETQKETAEAVKRNSLTLERVSENDSKITTTLELQQTTLNGLLIETPLIKGKQDDQIHRLRYAIKLLEYNASLIIEISRKLQIETKDMPDRFADPED